MELENDSKPRKKFKRKMTSFLCQEMLYDYVLERLDEERKASVTEFLKTDRESQGALETVQMGLDYARVLGKAELKTELQEQLIDSENILTLGRRYSNWREWPETLRWSISAVLISTSVAAIIGFIPWNRLPTFRQAPQDKNTVYLAEIDTNAATQQIAAQDPEADPNEVPDESGDFDAPINETNNGAPPQHLADHQDYDAPVKTAQQKKPDAKLAGLQNKQPVKSAPTTLPATAPKMEPPKPAVNLQANAPSVQPPAPAPAPADPADPDAGLATTADGMPVETADMPTDAQAAVDAKGKKRAKGFVYRAFMTLSNVTELTPKIAEQIRELGGEKAGEVELGWRKGNGSYFHFSLPESNEQKVLEKLRAYGPVRISKDPHPRVMPQGQVRFILWVDAADGASN